MLQLSERHQERLALWLRIDGHRPRSLRRRGGRARRRQWRGQIDPHQDSLGRPSADFGFDRVPAGGKSRWRRQARRSISASQRCSRIWRCAKTSTSSPTSFLGASFNRIQPRRGGDGSEGLDVAQRAFRTHSRASAIPSRRCRAVSARRWPSRVRCCWRRSLIMLDEPTAALGVAQTAEVLNLIERLKARGLGRHHDQSQHGGRASRRRPYCRAAARAQQRCVHARRPPTRNLSAPSRALPTTPCPAASERQRARAHAIARRTRP